MIKNFAHLRRLTTKTIQWALGGFFVLASAAGVSAGDKLSGLFFLLLAIVCTPPGSTIYRKLPRRLPLWAKYVVAFCLLIGAAATATPAELPAQQEDASEEARPQFNQETFEVASITDGDTIKVLIDGKTETIRLVNMNAPESVDPRRPVQCLGVEASDQMKALVEGRRVRLESDPTQSDRDRYGRLLRFVFLEDGTDVGLRMIQLGYAHSTPYGNTPHPYLDEYEQAESQAQENQRGLWDSSRCPGEIGKEAFVD